MEAAELARWTRFAAKGGIGKCTAVADCVAENADDLMFLKDDEITVLMQLNELPGVFLGYCEGVVGRFNKNDVHFHSKLKKPIMAKRSSVTASTTSTSNNNYNNYGGQGKSPTPPYGKTPSPMMGMGESPVPPLQPLAVRRVRVSLDEQVSAAIAAFVVPAEKGAGEQVPGVEMGALRLGKARGSFGSMREKVEGEDVNWVFEKPRMQSLAPPSPLLEPSSHITTTFVDEPLPTFTTSPSSISVPLFDASTHRSSYISSHTSIRSSYSQATLNEDDNDDDDPTLHLNISNLQDPPTPISPPIATPATTATSAPSTATFPPDTSTSTYFDNSRISLALSDGEVGIGLSLLQDLADGASNDGWSDSDSDSDSQVRRRPSTGKNNNRKGSVRSKGSSKRDTVQEDPAVGAGGTRLGEWRKSIVSVGSRYSGSSSGDEGLGYEDTETGHGLEAVITQTQQAFLGLDTPAPGLSSRQSTPSTPPQEQQTITMTMSFPPVAPLSPRFKSLMSIPIPIPVQKTRIEGPAKGEDYEYEFPPPPTHTPSLSRSSGGLFNSFTGPSTADRPALSMNTFVDPYQPDIRTTVRPALSASTFVDPHHSQPQPQPQPQPDFRERRPSLAPSSTSASSWEGAADIYDDYRYSRFSMGGASSRTGRTSFASSKRVSESSSKLGGAGGGGGDVPPFVDDPEARSRVDSSSGAGRPSVDSTYSQRTSSVHGLGGGIRTRSRSNTNASVNPLGGVASSSSTPLVGTPPAPPMQIRPAEPYNTDHRKTESLASDAASLYTQSSVDKTSPRLDGSFGLGTTSTSSPLAPAFTLTASSTNTSPAGNRPAPLNLNLNQHQSQQGPVRSPLLHTSWGSPLTSPSTTQQQHPFTSAPIPAPIRVSSSNVLSSGSTPPSSSAGYTGTGEGFGGGRGMPASATYFLGLEALGRVIAGKDEEEEAAGGAGVGRQKKMEVRRVSVAESVVRVRVRDEEEDMEDVGRGRRIVVEEDGDEDEDEDEVVIGQEVEGEKERDGKRDSSVMVGSRSMGLVLHESPASSPEPQPEPEWEIMGTGRLVAMNRTPSLSSDEEGKQPRLETEVTTIPPSFQVHAPPLASSPPSTTTSSTLRPTPSSSSSPSPSPSPTPAPSHLRPSLSELRPEGQGQRRSLFLPHPNAPKPPSAHSPGPMYIAQQQPPPPQAHSQQMRGGVMQTIRMALMQGPGPGRGRGPTIYGIATKDLSAAAGPVLMHFSVNPPPATAPPPGPGSGPQVAPVPVQAVRRVGSAASLDAIAKGGEGGVGEGEGGGRVLIPRANFFPKVGAARPRSRSFSGFQSMTAEIPLPIQRSREEGSAEMPSASEIKRALSPIVASPTTPSSGTQGNMNAPPKSSPLRGSSLFSRSPDAAAAAGRSLRPPNSPLGQSSFSQKAGSVPSSPTHNRPAPQLRQITSRSTLNETPAASTRITLSDSTSPPPKPHPSRPSVDTDAASIHSTHSNIVSPPPTLGRQNSLRTKLSLPNLRRNLGRQDEPSNSGQVLDSPVVDGETLQVQDMDFELVRPNIPQFQAARTSEDSGVMGRDDAKFLRAESPAMSVTASPHSPTIALDSAAAAAVSSSGTSGAWQPMKSSNAPPRAQESESSMDAHRQRELKWMSVLGSVPPAQARKSKKVKKLLFDGVPSSVRYLVWSQLTDGKARCVPGVYAQLGGRGRVPAHGDVERDVQRCFVDHPQLQSTQGPVLSLLQAYLTMVPDVQYATGLTLIAGHLLLLAPEEDAFWIFVSIMDTHIRPYFASTGTQIDVDASLFNRALESIDPTLAKKLFMDLSISPSAICRPWFTSLFVGSLPSDYLNRVWDIFLFEGVPFLFRVALALVSCCRRQILDSTSEASALAALLRPTHALLPPSPEALITLAFAVKLKDDDIRKQRVKLEAQVKRQTQMPRMVSVPGSISLPRT